MNFEVLKQGLKQINLSGSVAKGFNTVIKAIIKGKAKMVVLAEDCDNKQYKELITGLCKTYNVPLVSSGDVKKAELGAVLGMSYLKADGSLRRQINCSACAVLRLGKIRTPDVEAFIEAFLPEKAE